MHMICFTYRSDGTKFYFPYYDVVCIAENQDGTVIRVRDRSCNDTRDFYIQEEAQEILDQMKQISKGE